MGVGGDLASSEDAKKTRQRNEPMDKAKIREQRVLADIYRQRALSPSEKESRRKKPVKPVGDGDKRKVKKTDEDTWLPKRAKIVKSLPKAPKMPAGPAAPKGPKTGPKMPSKHAPTKPAHGVEVPKGHPSPKKVEKADIPKDPPWAQGRVKGTKQFKVKAEWKAPKPKMGPRPGSPGEEKLVIKPKGKVAKKEDKSMKPGGVGSPKKNGTLMEKEGLKAPTAPKPPQGSDKVKGLSKVSDKPSFVARATNQKPVEPKPKFTMEHLKEAKNKLKEQRTDTKTKPVVGPLQRSLPQNVTLEKTAYIDSLFVRLDELKNERDPEKQQIRKSLFEEVTKVELMTDEEFTNFLEKNEKKN
jgi:hypothetical protein